MKRQRVFKCLWLLYGYQRPHNWQQSRDDEIFFLLGFKLITTESNTLRFISFAQKLLFKVLMSTKLHFSIWKTDKACFQKVWVGVVTSFLEEEKQWRHFEVENNMFCFVSRKPTINIHKDATCDVVINKHRAIFLTTEKMARSPNSGLQNCELHDDGTGRYRCDDWVFFPAACSLYIWNLTWSRLKRRSL